MAFLYRKFISKVNCAYRFKQFLLQYKQDRDMTIGMLVKFQTCHDESDRNEKITIQGFK